MQHLSLPLLSTAIVAPLAALPFIWAARSAPRARLIATVAASVSLLAALEAARQVAAAGFTALSEPWSVALFGQSRPLLGVDALASVPLLLFALLALLTILFAPKRDMEPRSAATILVVLTGTLLATAADSLILFLAGWALSAAPVLSAFGADPKDVRARALPLIANLASTVCLAAGFGLIASAAVDAGLAAPLSVFDLRQADAPGGVLAFAFLLLAVWLRKGLFPFHSWVLAAFDRSPLMATVLLVNGHLGAFLLARIVIPVMPDICRDAFPLLSNLALFTGMYTAVLGLAEREPRRLLGLLFIGQGCCILVGLQSATPAGVTGGLVHWIVVALATTCLAGVYRLVESRVGPSTGDRYLGLADQFPRLAVFFAVAGLALVGIPGTLGFAAEELLIHGTLESHPHWGVALPIATALNAIHLFRLFARLFLGTRPRTAVSIPDALPRERLAFSTMVLALVLTGVFPSLAVDLRNPAGKALVHDLRSAELRR